MGTPIALYLLGVLGVPSIPKDFKFIIYCSKNLSQMRKLKSEAATMAVFEVFNSAYKANSPT